MFSILDRYIGKTIFNTTMITLFIVVSISSMIKFFDQLRKTTQEGAYGTISAGYYILLSIPNEIVIFLPMVVLLGSLFGLGILMQHSELMVMQVSGFTRLQIALSVMKTAIPLMILIMIVEEFVVPKSEQLVRNFQIQQPLNGSFLTSRKSVWTKSGNNFIYIERINRNNQLNGIRIYKFDDKQNLKKILYADTAIWNKKMQYWKLNQINESDFSNPVQITGKYCTSVEWKSNLTPDTINMVNFYSATFSIRELYNYIQYLKQSGQKSEGYQLNMWRKIFQPLSVSVMMLMSLSFIFGLLQNTSMSIRVVTGISFGFLFYILNRILGPISLIYNLPPILGAILPTLIFFIISTWMIMKYSEPFRKIC